MDGNVARFDRWYADMADDQLRDAIVGHALGLPVDLRVTGLLPAIGLDEVITELALRPGAVLIDLACGRGGYSRDIARRSGATVIGVDISAVAVDQARESIAGLDGPPSVTFRVGAIEASGLPDDCADAVLCIDSYQFATSLEEMCAEASRIIRSTGVLVLTGAMRASTLDGPVGENPLARALSATGWTDVRLAPRPSWLAIEKQLWTDVITEPRTSPALAALKAEANELLPAMPHLQRFLAVARRP